MTEHVYNQQLQADLKEVHPVNEQQLHQASYKEVTTKLAEVQHELDQAANREQILKQELQNQLDIHQQLQQSHDKAIADNNKLNDDNLAKTQQVDELKTELAQYRLQVVDQRSVSGFEVWRYVMPV